jgi:hypothetical protein
MRIKAGIAKSNVDLETQLPLLIKNGLATALLNINSTRITITSYYYNYPSY